MFLLRNMLSVGDPASYKRHVVQRIFLNMVPNFSSLLQLEDGSSWPSMEEANRRFAKVVLQDKRDPEGTFVPLCQTLLADEESYGIAKQIYMLCNSLQKKDSRSLAALWKLKLSLLQMPTLLAIMPNALLQALRAIERPTMRETWGMILLTKQHSVTCGICERSLDFNNTMRVQCLCSPFGYLAHASCVQGKKCYVCSSPFSLTNLKGGY